MCVRTNEGKSRDERSTDGEWGAYCRPAVTSSLGTLELHAPTSTLQHPRHKLYSKQLSNAGSTDYRLFTMPKARDLVLHLLDRLPKRKRKTSSIGYLTKPLVVTQWP